MGFPALQLSSNGTVSSATTFLNVEVEQSQLFAVIEGSDRTAQAGQDLEIVSTSYDPDDSDAQLWHSWTCKRFTDASTTAQSCPGFSAAVESYDRTLVVDGGVLQTGSTYQFTLVVSDPSTEREATTSVLVTPVDAATIDVSVVVPQGSYAGAVGVLNPDARVVLAAVVGNHSNYNLSGLEVQYAWSVTDLPSNAVLSSSLGGAYLVLDGRAMAPLKTYTFSVSVTVPDLAVTGSASLTAYFNLPPTSGSFVVTPASGVALSTLFSLQALYWCDEDLPLRYTFYYRRESSSSLVPLSLLSEQSALETVLPLGNPSAGATTVVMCVSDLHGARTCVEQDVELSPAPENTTALCTSLYDAAYEALSADQDGDSAISALLNLFVYMDSEGSDADCGDWSSFVGLVVNASQVQQAENAAFDQESLLSSLLSQVAARTSAGLDTQSQLDLLAHLQQILDDHHEFAVQVSTDTSTHTLQSLSTLMATGLVNASVLAGDTQVSSAVVKVVHDVAVLQGANMVPGEPAFALSPGSFNYSVVRAAVGKNATSTPSVTAESASTISGVQDGFITSDVTLATGDAVFQVPYQVVASVPQGSCAESGLQFSVVDWIVNPYATPSSNADSGNSGFDTAHVAALELIDCNGLTIPVHDTTSSILLDVHVPTLDEAVFVYDNVTIYASCDGVGRDERLQVFCDDTSAWVVTVPATSAADPEAFVELECAKDVAGYHVTCPQYGFEPHCEFYDSTTGEWSSAGCELHGYDTHAGTVTCASNHLTEFTTSAHKYLQSSGRTVSATKSVDEDILTKSPAILAFVLGLLALYIVMFAVGSRIDELHERKRLTTTLFTAYIQLRAAASGMFTYRGDAASADDQSSMPDSEMTVQDKPLNFWRAWLQALRLEHYILSLVWPMAPTRANIPMNQMNRGGSRRSSKDGSVMSKHLEYTSAAKSAEEERYTFRQKLTMCVVEVMTLLFIGCFLFGECRCLFFCFLVC